ncbi:hypothetical protein Mal64_08970 [Pseudobythopirellula maris]|uniref:DUF1553 domain-containing protein n=1 Tax=Pseudobythopirellula maris TaxID=2527991 RepID=A0A5C5ZTG1_9BACT|nr:DUF1549 domain-containing protein [Pseudobythopirellula maris]TWT90506.1 hypothetical protein Mal64_08970 [Pseudobythopirellula maris]
MASAFQRWLRRAWLPFGLSLAVLVAVLMSGAARADVDMGAADLNDAPDEDRVMIATIDASLAEHWEREGVEQAPLASDGAFLRRVSLDLIGVAPRVAEARAFLADPSPTKRSELVQRLLASPRHAEHMATVWRQRLLPEDDSFGARNSSAGVQNWLRDRFARNVRYDNLAYDLLVSTNGDQLGPAYYFAAHELKPEKLAANATREFLGVSLECAECHDHPFTDWKQDDFWAFAAFFARVRTDDGGMGEVAMRTGRPLRITDAEVGELTPPDYEAAVPPRYLGGGEPGDSPYESRRMQLALWMAERDNPYLARAAVNGLWRQLFGKGLVEEINADGAHLPDDHAALLDELSDWFVDSGFDLRRLMGVLAQTEAYQLASHGSEGQKVAPGAVGHFAAMSPKTLTPEQLYDSLARIAPAPNYGNGSMGGAVLFDPQRDAFVSKMRSAAEDRREFGGSTLQALYLLNGDTIARVTNPELPGAVAALKAPFYSNRERVESLFLATLSRPPLEEERTAALGYLEKNGQGSDLPAALSDLLWALLNNAEMAFEP